MKQIFLGLLAIAALSATSCQKENNKPATGANNSIQGHWTINSILTKEDGFDPYTYSGKSTDFYKFGTDGNVAVKVDVYEVTASYQVVDATHISIDGDVEEIKELTAHKLVLHSAATEESPEDITVTLSR